LDRTSPNNSASHRDRSPAITSSPTSSPHSAPTPPRR
jgi:hypothetical protein